LDEYDVQVFPGFMRRPMARWNEDGSCAPVARARGPKGEAFILTLKQSEIDEDIGHIEGEIGIGKKPKKKKVVPPPLAAAAAAASPKMEEGVKTEEEEQPPQTTNYE